MTLDFIVLTGSLFHNGDGSVSKELSGLRKLGATDRQIEERFMELYPECRFVVLSENNRGLGEKQFCPPPESPRP